MKDNFKTELENVLSYLLAADDAPQTRRGRITFPISLSHFSYAEPFFSRMLDTLGEEEMGPARFSTVPFRRYPEDAERIAKHIDVTLLTNIDDQDDHDSRFALSRWRTVPAESVRGKIRGAAPINVEMSTAIIQKDLSYVTARTYLGRVGQSFRVLEYTDPRIGKLDAANRLYHERTTMIALSVAVVRHYSWGVRFSYPGAPGVHFSTDPSGAAALLAVRDVKKGVRRQSILHWVAEHWRKRRADPTAFTKVREHMRGKTVFSWDGLQCEVVPSAADLASYKLGGGQIMPPWLTKDRDRQEHLL